MARLGPPIPAAMPPADRVQLTVAEYKATLLGGRPRSAHSNASNHERLRSLNLHQRVWDKNKLDGALQRAHALGVAAKLRKGQATSAHPWVAQELEVVALKAGDEAADPLNDSTTDPDQPQRVAKVRPSTAGSLRVAVMSAESIVLKYMLMHARIVAASNSIPNPAWAAVASLLASGDGSELGGRPTEMTRVIRSSVYHNRAIHFQGKPVDRETRRAMYLALDVFHDGWIAVEPSLFAIRSYLEGDTPVGLLAFVFTALGAHQSNYSLVDHQAVRRYIEARMAANRSPQGIALNCRPWFPSYHRADMTAANGITSSPTPATGTGDVPVDASLLWSHFCDLDRTLFIAGRPVVGWRDALSIAADAHPELSAFGERLLPQPSRR